jgi:hypothetical protein
MVATAILVAEADKLTLGQELTARVPHSVEVWTRNSGISRSCMGP